MMACHQRGQCLSPPGYRAGPLPRTPPNTCGTTSTTPAYASSSMHLFLVLYLFIGLYTCCASFYLV